MKPLSSAIAAALILFSAQGVAEQTTQPVVTSCANVVVVPPSQEHPPFDLNHMGTGSDKSDALGVPYYNQHAIYFSLTVDSLVAGYDGINAQISRYTSDFCHAISLHL